MRVANDNPDAGAGSSARSRPWRAAPLPFLLPALATGLLYGALWAGLAVWGQGGSPLSRLALAVAALAAPAMAAHGLLRFLTFRLAPDVRGLSVCPGFPCTEPRFVPYRSIRRVEMRRGLADLLAGSATLLLRLDGPEVLVLAFMRDATATAAAIEAGVAGERERRMKAGAGHAGADENPMRERRA